jgi:hypothetical protein
VNTRAISTSTVQSACDVCGRTLLRGERAHIYLHGGTRHSVCELCTTRALHGGWVREGTLPDYGESSARVDRRRSLLGRLRRRDAPDRFEVQEPPSFDDEPASHDDLPPEPVAPPPVRADAAPRPPRNPPPAREPQGMREPRHVRAVPTSVEHKISSAVDLFNASEHPKTVAGIARSLGIPEASVLPAEHSAVHLILAWELCWYRYEVDLSDEVPTVRVSGQGYELDELAPGERCGNVTAGERGTLTL